jgi:hypothetical protein
MLWAEQEFSHAQLGDARRTQRLVRIAARAAEHLGSLLTEVFADQQAERAAAYDFLENPAVHPDAIAWAHHRATAQRCRGQPFVFVPVDGSSLSFPDPEGHKGLGFIGSHKAGGRGLKVMSAVAVGVDGVPLGVVSQAFWLVRLTYLGRHHPHQPASLELSEAERRALILARQLPISADQMTIGQAVLELAKLGGYTGKSSGGPPGFKVLARGLDQIRTLALVLARGFRGT